MPKSRASHRNRKPTQKRRPAGRSQLFYGVLDGGAGPSLVFMKPNEARRLSTLHAALASSTTWGEFRSRIPAREYAAILQMWELDSVPPTDAFSGADLIGDGDYPGWPEQMMLDWVPDAIQKKYGSVTDSVHNGLFLHLEPALERDIVAAFAAAGYRCIRKDALVQLASGY